MYFQRPRCFTIVSTSMVFFSIRQPNGDFAYNMFLSNWVSKQFQCLFHLLSISYISLKHRNSDGVIWLKSSPSKWLRLPQIDSDCLRIGSIWLISALIGSNCLKNIRRDLFRYRTAVFTVKWDGMKRRRRRSWKHTQTRWKLNTIWSEKLSDIMRERERKRERDGERERERDWLRLI